MHRQRSLGLQTVSTPGRSFWTDGSSDNAFTRVGRSTSKTLHRGAGRVWSGWGGGYESLCRSTFVAGIVSGATSSGDVVGGDGELCGKWGLLPLQFRLAYDCTATERSAVALKHYHWFLFSRRLYKAANIRRRNRRLISRSKWDQKMPRPFVEVLVLFVSMKQTFLVPYPSPNSEEINFWWQA